MSADTAATQPGRRLGSAVLLVSLAGLLVSCYLVYEHFTSSTSFACPETGTVNCVKVTTSTYSTFAGVPVAVLGLAFYLAMVAASLPRFWSSPRLRRGRLVAAAGGVVFALYLVWAELFRIDAICLWCTGVHAITLVLFALLAVDVALAPVGNRRRA
jgi:uncharacterized membrane protein